MGKQEWLVELNEDDVHHLERISSALMSEIKHGMALSSCKPWDEPLLAVLSGPCLHAYRLGASLRSCMAEGR